MSTLPNPSSSSRGQKAIALVASGALDDRTALYLDDPYSKRLIPSCTTEGAFYVVSLDSCSCPDFRFRNAVCKHRIALKVQQVLDTAALDNAVLTGEAHPELDRILGKPRQNTDIPAVQIEREPLWLFLNRWLREHGWAQVRLADAVEVHETVVGRWLHADARRRARPSRQTLPRLAEVLDVPVQDLVVMIIADQVRSPAAEAAARLEQLP